MFTYLRRFRAYLRELRIRRQLQNVKPATGHFNREKWRLTQSVVGVENKEPILCPYCLTSDKHEQQMVLRKSIMGRSEELNFRNAVFDLIYKCPRCSLVLCFGIAVPERHFRIIENLRRKNRIGRVYAPEENWLEHEVIKRRLEALGYW